MRRVIVYNDPGKHRKLYEGWLYQFATESFEGELRTVAVVEREDGHVDTPWALSIVFKEPHATKGGEE